jgi:hypothetical protein
MYHAGDHSMTPQFMCILQPVYKQLMSLRRVLLQNSTFLVFGNKLMEIVTKRKWPKERVLLL